MSTERPCRVIGAGAVGLASALQLARRGAAGITVLEAAHPPPARRASRWGSSRRSTSTPLDIALRVDDALLRRARARPRPPRHPQRLPAPRPSTESSAAFRASVEVQRELGVAGRHGARAPARSRRIVPDMRADDVDGGLYGPSDGFLDGHLYCSLLGELATDSACEIHGRAVIEARRARRRPPHVLPSAGAITLRRRRQRGRAVGGRVASLLGPSSARPAAPRGRRRPPHRHRWLRHAVGHGLHARDRAQTGSTSATSARGSSSPDCTPRRPRGDRRRRRLRAFGRARVPRGGRRAARRSACPRS